MNVFVLIFDLIILTLSYKFFCDYKEPESDNNNINLGIGNPKLNTVIGQPVTFNPVMGHHYQIINNNHSKFTQNIIPDNTNNQINSYINRLENVEMIHK